MESFYEDKVESSKLSKKVEFRNLV